MASYEGGASPYDKKIAPKPTGVSTHNFTMQTRLCAGGCGKEFKCLASSKQTRAFGDCESRCKTQVPSDEAPLVKDAGEAQVMELHDYEKPKQKVSPSIGEMITSQPMAKKAKEIQARKKALKAESRKRLEEKKLAKTPTKEAKQTNKVVQKLAKTPTQTNKVARRKKDIKGVDRQKSNEAKWNELVNKAKATVKRMHIARMEVAGWAMEACEIKWGGGDHWSGHKNVKTMSAFAREVGINYKTLAQWVRIKRNIHDKLPKGVWKDDKYMIAMRVDKKIKRGMKKKDVMQIYLKEMERKDDGIIVGQAVKRLSTMSYFIHKKIRWSEVDMNEIREMRDYCADIMDRINLELGEKYEAPPEDAEFEMDES